MMFLFLLAKQVFSIRNHHVIINNSVFKNSKVLFANECPYTNHNPAERYTNSNCGDISNNNFVDLKNNGAIVLESDTLVTTISGNTFTGCTAHSGAAASLSCLEATFNDNIINNVETSGSGDTFGAVYFHSTSSNLKTFTSHRNSYSICSFFKGGGFETTCNNGKITLNDDSFSQCTGNNFGGGIHLNHINGDISIIDCSFTTCTSPLGGAIGIDCQEDNSNFDVHIKGCYITSCTSNDGSAIGHWYKSGSTIEVEINRSSFNNTRIENCNSNNKIIYLKATTMSVSYTEIKDSTGDAIILRDGLADPTLTVSNCIFTRITLNSGAGSIISGAMTNLIINSCTFNEITYLWKITSITQLSLNGCTFNTVTDTSSSSISTSGDFKYIFTGCTFDTSNLHIFATISSSNLNMLTKFDDCTFVNINVDNFIVKVATPVEVNNCHYTSGTEMFQFANTIKSLAIKNCDISLSNDATLFKIMGLPDSPQSIVTGCTFTINAGTAIISESANLNFVGNRFSGSSTGTFITLKGNCFFEGNTFDAKSSPVIRFGSGQMKFSKTNLNCIKIMFSQTFDTYDSGSMDNVVDSDNKKIIYWSKENNGCFEDNLSPSNTFSISREFSLSNEFKNSKLFSLSGKFSLTSKFGITNRFSETKSFEKSKIFSDSKAYQKTNNFAKSSQLSGSSYFENTVIFSRTTNFGVSNGFSRTFLFFNSNHFSISNKFKGSDEFSFTNKFAKTNIYSLTNVFVESNQYSASNNFKNSKYFSQSSDFKMTYPFSNTKDFIKSELLSDSSIFEESKQFSKSKAMKDTENFSNTEGFINSELLSNSIKFHSSFKFSKSDALKETNAFSSSEQMIKTAVFTESVLFSEVDSSYKQKTDFQSKTKDYQSSLINQKEENLESSLNIDGKFSSLKSITHIGDEHDSSYMKVVTEDQKAETSIINTEQSSLNDKYNDKESSIQTITKEIVQTYESQTLFKETQTNTLEKVLSSQSHENKTPTKELSTTNHETITKAQQINTPTKEIETPTLKTQTQTQDIESQTLKTQTQTLKTQTQDIESKTLRTQTHEHILITNTEENDKASQTEDHNVDPNPGGDAITSSKITFVDGSLHETTAIPNIDTGNDKKGVVLGVSLFFLLLLLVIIAIIIYAIYKHNQQSSSDLTDESDRETIDETNMSNVDTTLTNTGMVSGILLEGGDENDDDGIEFDSQDII